MGMGLVWLIGLWYGHYIRTLGSHELRIVGVAIDLYEGGNLLSFSLIQD